jgi:hypothetical protein
MSLASSNKENMVGYMLIRLITIVFYCFQHYLEFHFNSDIFRIFPNFLKFLDFTFPPFNSLFFGYESLFFSYLRF